MKIAKSDDDMEGGVAPTVQFRETNEYPVVFKWHCSATRFVAINFPAPNRATFLFNASNAL